MRVRTSYDSANVPAFSGAGAVSVNGLDEALT